MAQGASCGFLKKALRLPDARNWEVLNGIGVDGVGVIFPPFLRIFPPFSAHFPPFSTHFSPFSSLFAASPEGQGQTTAIYCKNGEFHSDPVCTDPVQNFPKKFQQQTKITKREPGLIQPVLTVLVFWSWVRLVLGSQL